VISPTKTRNCIYHHLSLVGEQIQIQGVFLAKHIFGGTRQPNFNPRIDHQISKSRLKCEVADKTHREKFQGK
jgi:hypothetical protein